MKVKPRNGGMLLWGRLPPAIEVPKAFICTLFAGTEGVYIGGAPLPPPAQIALTGLFVPPPAVTHWAV